MLLSLQVCRIRINIRRPCIFLIGANCSTERVKPQAATRFSSLATWWIAWPLRKVFSLLGGRSEEVLGMYHPNQKPDYPSVWAVKPVLPVSPVRPAPPINPIGHTTLASRETRRTCDFHMTGESHTARTFCYQLIAQDRCVPLIPYDLRRVTPVWPKLSRMARATDDSSPRPSPLFLNTSICASTSISQHVALKTYYNIMTE